MQHDSTDRLKELYDSGHRQKEDCTCGPSSLSMIAAAWDIGQYPELDWIPESRKKWLQGISEFRERGMALHEVALAAELQMGSKVEVSLKRAFAENYQTFLNDLSLMKSSSDCALIVNFPQDLILRRTFNTDQGSPHFSPIGDYQETTGQILVLDVDYEVTESYRVSAESMFDGMSKINPAFGVPRGWLFLRKRNL